MSTSCGCEPKKYNLSMGCCVPVLGPVENYYTKPQIDRMIDEIESAITSGCCITPEEVDEKIEEAISGITVSGVTEEQMNQAITSAMTIVEGEIPSLSGYATEQWVEDKHYITGVDLSDYATKEEIPVVPTSNTAFTNDAGYLTEHQPIKTINGQSLIGTGDIEIGTGGTIDLSNYYTTAQTVSLVESAVTRVEGEMPSLSGYATEQWVEDKHYITGVDLSNYALKSEIPVVPTSNTAFTNDAGYLTEHQSLSGYATEAFVSAYTYDKETIDEKVAGGGTFDPTQYYTKTATDALLNEKLDATAYTPTDLSNYYTKSETNNQISSATADMATKTWVGEQGYLTEHQHLKTLNGESLVGDGNIVISGGSGITSGEVQTMIDNATSGLQQTLSAGTNIQINNNVISATDTTYTAGDNISISNQNVISTVTKFWCGTEAQWSLISGNTDANTIYLIHQ